jgi:hypothetical protein
MSEVKGAGRLLTVKLAVTGWGAEELMRSCTAGFPGMVPVTYTV